MTATDVSPRSVDALIAHLAAGNTVKYLFFWGHRQRRPGSIREQCLSQWYPAACEVGGSTYASAEHYMMAAKARLFGDGDAERAVLRATSPAEAKEIGRTVHGFDEATWRRERFRIVFEASMGKFARSPELKEYLVGTGRRVLVEASPSDRVWGIGVTRDDPAAGDPARWRGLNLLGFALMEARAALAAG